VIPSAVDIFAARQRIRSHVDVTPLRESHWLSAAAGTPVWLKLECIQVTGSFKIRGALNALMQLVRVPRAPTRVGPHEHNAAGDGVVTASAGNHGRAIALAAEKLGIHATVFTPRNAPHSKLHAITWHGAELRSEAKDYDEAETAAKQFARDMDLPFISAYNHPDVIAGAGTIALEIFETHPSISTIVVPVGGAGLVGGIAIAAKALAPQTRIVGVEVEASCAFTISRRNGRITVIDPQPTLADGLGGNMDPDTITFDIVQRYVDDLVTVSERDLAEGLRGLVRDEHLVVEGAGAAAPAAVMAGKARGRGAIAAVVSGSNIDLARLREVISG
jgi:threonine dehydratase